MKATGIVRRIDDLGRIVIPKEIRRINGINDGDSMEIFVDREGKIIIKKYWPNCVICGKMHDVTVDKDSSNFFNGNYVCDDCIGQIKASEVK